MIFDLMWVRIKKKKILFVHPEMDLITEEDSPFDKAILLFVSVFEYYILL